MIPRRRHRTPWLGWTAAGLLVFLYAPLVVASIYAFNSGPNLSWPPRGVSTRWFAQLFADPQFIAALKSSLIAAVSSSTISTVVGTAAAFVFTRRTSRLSAATAGLARLPIMLPPLFIGVGILATLELTGIPPSMGTIVAGHVVIIVPFVITIIVARLRTLDIELELAARDLGASPVQALRRITLPLIAPAIVGSLFLGFAFSFDEILVTNFTSGSLVTVPIYVLGRLRRYVDPSANAVAFILLLIPWVTFGVAALILRRSGDGESTATSLLRL